MRWYLQTAILSLSYFISTTVSQNIFSTIPQCYQDCLQQSGDFTCNGIDIPCSFFRYLLTHRSHADPLTRSLSSLQWQLHHQCPNMYTSELRQQPQHHRTCWTRLADLRCKGCTHRAGRHRKCREHWIILGCDGHFHLVGSHDGDV